MTTPDIDVLINCPLWESLPFDATALAQKIVPLAFTAADRPPLLESRSVEISVLLTDSKEIQILNRDYRGKDKPTNVLSFAALDDDELLADLPAEAALPLGDIIISFEILEKEAKESEITFHDHYAHMLVHGTLHLLGYDHEDDEDAETMENLEIHILNGLGIENPYTTTKIMA